jgi:predicted N-formylglutamate amidohydrolase
MKKSALIISCEHAVDTVPSEYSGLFLPFKSLLATHRGIDFGALEIALHLRTQFPCDFVQAQATRLLIDCNRSIKNSSCFSEVSCDLPFTEKNIIINTYYLPFREQVIALIDKRIQQGLQVCHLSIHSFTPELHGEIRTTDIGLLYDPKRPSEKALSRLWKTEIKQIDPALRVRMNYPYSGTSDGFTSALRKQFNDASYLGIEVESNQALTKIPHSLNHLKNILAHSLSKIIA